MDRRVISLCLSLSLMLLFAGCSSKKVVFLVRRCSLTVRSGQDRGDPAGCDQDGTAGALVRPAIW